MSDKFQTSLKLNCVKYRAALETIQEAFLDRGVSRLADQKELGINLEEPWETHTLSVQLKEVVDHLQRGREGMANSLTHSLMDDQYWDDPVVNLLYGLTFYHIWWPLFVPFEFNPERLQTVRNRIFLGSDRDLLPLRLFPLKLPIPTDDLVDEFSLNLDDANYKGAVQYLSVACYVPVPPLDDGLYALLQMLIVCDQIQEAFNALEWALQSLEPKPLLLLRLKYILLECLDDENYSRICASLEEVLKEYPTCNFSLTKLVDFHRCGHYNTLNLVEVIANYLDVTRGSVQIWNTFARCLHKICVEDVHGPRLPESFKKSRCETWQPKYFRTDLAEAEIESGNFELLTYKAIIAAHLIGPKNDYVVRAKDFIERSDNTSLSSLLKENISSSERLSENH